jgi:myo-inositol-1(or 4)-monophosphatase
MVYGETDPLILLRTATEAARSASELLNATASQPRAQRQKGFRDWVTDADLAAQREIAAVIRHRHPDHGFLPEETAPDLPDEGPVIWIVDPLDGTSNYSRQIPAYCVSIAACVDGEVSAAVVLDPLRDEMYRAARGHGAERNGVVINVSGLTELEESIIGLDWAHEPAARERTVVALQSVVHKVRTLRAIGSAALALAWVACGRLDAYFNVGMKPWDIAAGALLLEEAGGRLSTWRAEPWVPPDSEGDIVAATPGLHGPLSRLIARER